MVDPSSRSCGLSEANILIETIEKELNHLGVIKGSIKCATRRAN